MEGLRTAGHDVAFVSEIRPGATDQEVFRLALDEERLLITEDKDFGELTFRLNRQPPGILLLRFPIAERGIRLERLLSTLAGQEHRLFRSFTVLDDRKVRIRAHR